MTPCAHSETTFADIINSYRSSSARAIADEGRPSATLQCSTTYLGKHRGQQPPYDAQTHPQAAVPGAAPSARQRIALHGPRQQHLQKLCSARAGHTAPRPSARAWRVQATQPSRRGRSFVRQLRGAARKRGPTRRKATTGLVAGRRARGGDDEWTAVGACGGWICMDGRVL